MTNKDAIRSALSISRRLYQLLTDDLTDADLRERAVPGANTIAWQLGHALGTEFRFLKQLGAEPPAVPAGFAERHGSAQSKSDDPAGMLTKAEYLALAAQSHAALLAALEACDEADFDKPTEGPIAAIAPTRGAVWMLLSSHAAFHAGQFSVVRRKLGKPVVF